MTLEIKKVNEYVLGGAMKVFYAYLLSELIEEVDDDLLYDVVSMIGEQN